MIPELFFKKHLAFSSYDEYWDIFSWLKNYLLDIQSANKSTKLFYKWTQNEANIEIKVPLEALLNLFKGYAYFHVVTCILW